MTDTNHLFSKKYLYEGIHDFKDVFIESNIPREQWGFGTELVVYHKDYKDIKSNENKTAL